MTIKEIPISEKQLGAHYSKESTSFNVWAPTHDKISLALYDTEKGLFRSLFPMEKAPDGVFSTCIEGDLHGYYYTYLVDGPKGISEVTDPYSVTASANSVRSGILDPQKTNPENWETHHRPKGSLGCDAVLYEVHVKDFSGHPYSGMENKGKFLAFTENGTSIQNTKTGLDHIVDLGVTHVHLMPVYDFLSVDEEVENLDGNYNWGYDPELYNAPEGSYASNPHDPVARVKELKAAIQALHENGVKVVLDVVYNHTYQTKTSNFNTLVPNYYYRMTEEGYFSNGSGCGNEFASENPMGRKFIIDSLLYWATEYKVDGFRFDLMALIDKETIRLAREALLKVDPEIIIYGEPWMGGLSTLPENMRVYKGVQCDQGYALFNDDFRDAIKGDNDGTGKGYIHGNRDMKYRIHTGIVGSIPYDQKYIGFTTHPCETINYFNSHDNLILSDKLKITSPDASEDQLIKLNKMAFNLLFLSQGTPFIHAGNEFMRDKSGYHNSYNAPLSINAIDWELKVKHIEFYKYVKGLIQLRKDYPCFRLKSIFDIQKRVHFIEENDFAEAFKDAIVYIIKEDASEDYDCLLVAHNPGNEPLLLSVHQMKEAILDFYIPEPEHEPAKVQKHHKVAHGKHHEALEHPKTTKHTSSKGHTPLKPEISNDRLKIDLLFDERGYLEISEAIDPINHHVVRVAPNASVVYRLGHKPKVVSEPSVK